MQGFYYLSQILQLRRLLNLLENVFLNILQLAIDSSEKVLDGQLDLLGDLGGC